jgi:hypothetical protein
MCAPVMVTSSSLRGREPMLPPSLRSTSSTLPARRVSLPALSFLPLAASDEPSAVAEDGAEAELLEAGCLLWLLSDEGIAGEGELLPLL